MAVEADKQQAVLEVAATDQQGVLEYVDRIQQVGTRLWHTARLRYRSSLRKNVSEQQIFGSINYVQQRRYE